MVGILLIVACSATVVAQPDEAQIRRARAQAEAQARAAVAAQASAGNQSESNGEGNEKSKDEGDKKEGDQSEEKQSGGDTVTRPSKPPKTPDPRELDVEPDEAGRVRFGFNGQPWPDVLQWLAGVCDYSLHWKELPSGYLNLTTQDSYSLPEARDLINRHLQTHGYAMLLSGEVLMIVKLDAIDPSLIPRVSEDELYDLQPHDIVKVTFSLPEGFEPKQVVEDIKHTLSKHAKVLPLAATKRLLAIDTVVNLRLVSALLNEERIEREGHELPRRFPLQYARAERVINTLYVVLGLDPAAQPSQMELQVQQQKMQLLMQMQGAGKDVARLLKKDGPPVYLAFNRHDNSILVNAPPPQMKIIERTIGILDIPPPGFEGGSGATTAAGSDRRYPKSYELESVKPDSLINSLEEIGNLDPLTELRGDSKAMILFARATDADHTRIEDIIRQLDGPKFRVEVYWLSRRHAADEVAGTIEALIGGKKEKKKDNRNSYFFWRYGNDEEEEEEIELRVGTDIESNRLFVRGNDSQIAEVRAFLAQIGELPEEGSAVGPGGDSPIRVFDALDRAATDNILEQLRVAWPAVSGGASIEIEDNREPENEADSETPSVETPKEDSASTQPTRFRFATLPESDTPGAGSADATDTNRSAASITVTKDGRLVIGSDDPEVLARLEQLVETLTPAQATFTEFRLDHVSARYVHGKLEDFYEDILNASKNEPILDWWGRVRDTGAKDQGARLSRRRPLRMVYNLVTNSIVVSNASTAQLAEIKRLIEIWDQPPLEDVILQRRFGMVPLRYSRARVIAGALKEVYRDLLSARDKEFDTEEDKGGGFTTEKLTQIEYSGAEHYGAKGPKTTQKTKAIETTFDGALSIGVDEVANILLISADAELYASVVDTIHQLDEEARPDTTVQVVRTGISADALRTVLAKSISSPWSGGRPEQSRQKQQQPNQQGGERGQDPRRQREAGQGGN